MEEKKLTVMIVDDSAVVRQTMKDIISSDPMLEVAGTAADPLIAAKKLESFIPDVIVLDIEMPRMDGLTFLRRLMNAHPVPVVICSSKTEDGSQNAIHALEYGAVEIIQKPKMGTKQFLEESKVTICDAVKAAAYTKVKKKSVTIPQKTVQPKLTADAVLSKGTAPLTIDTTDKVVVIGASTGGTEALREFIEQLPVDAPGIAIVQHMPEHFTAAFAKRLDGLARVTVKEAANNDSVLRGHVLIAPGNRHMLLKRSGARYYVEVREGPLVSRHRPSVDVLFRSAARYAGKNAIGVIMTGMGDDGARGMAEMHESGSFTIAQDEKSCVVFGMPNEAIKRGGVDEVLSLDRIAGRVLEKGQRG
ncbi:protein-glutamate methylesterase/protein-glutamine glutaminase [Sediminispirochaeta smaragdinae]|uniref:Protein-glutamate methylesterase/protein-glutamine glutaminase n=1 Tax=Sediminispirochaeta smaragdinae (strain DSM 11293 / JCM 15392 / SEBR 4228) TaxID=573413 RepID=E1R6D1_SEDSS|nr:chemotaxis response regulator protein-glutamate methylesterase [Sediminispirochaeta smaragdinae]ADK80949.1 response regulator receiver modulated CheB methylesterase [Sediminispirochaeta smaragdinae DSM 11293]